MVWSLLINVISGFLIVLAIFFDFLAADQARKKKTGSAAGWAIAAGILSIIGLIGFIVAAIIGRASRSVSADTGISSSLLDLALV